ncbi:hypothetical protein CsSME_00037689 [Camellia sinensis var. sinensis]
MAFCWETLDIEEMVSTDGNLEGKLSLPIWDLFSIGVTALGPRKKIVQSLSELKKESSKTTEIRTNASRDVTDETSRVAVSKLITDYFPGSVGHRKKDCTPSSGQREIEKSHADARRKQIVVKKNVMNGKLRDIPQWCCIPGTPFRVSQNLSPSLHCLSSLLSEAHLQSNSPVASLPRLPRGLSAVPLAFVALVDSISGMRDSCRHL